MVYMIRILLFVINVAILAELFNMYRRRNLISASVKIRNGNVATFGNARQIARGIRTHGEIFSKSYQINPKSDCIYHFPFDLEKQTDTVRLLFQVSIGAW